MASRAATLVKPKVKAKLKPVAKTIAKSSASKAVAKPTSVVKPSVTAKSSDRTAIVASPAKAKVAKTVTAKAKPKAIKTVEPKIVAKKVMKPLAAAAKPTKTLAVAGTTAVVGAASFETAAPKPRRRAKGEIRTRIYWAVFNQALRRVAVFEFDQRGEAEKRAAQLAKTSGEHHFIQKYKVIVQ